MVVYIYYFYNIKESEDWSLDWKWWWRLFCLALQPWFSKCCLPWIFLFLLYVVFSFCNLNNPTNTLWKQYANRNLTRHQLGSSKGFKTDTKRHSNFFWLEYLLLLMPCPHVYLCIMCLPGAFGGQMRSLDPKGIESQMVVNCIQALEIGPRFPGRAVNVLNCGAIFPVLDIKL